MPTQEIAIGGKGYAAWIESLSARYHFPKEVASDLPSIADIESAVGGAE